MILPLRRRHRHTFTVLAFLLPAVFVLGIAARRPVQPVIDRATASTVPETFTATGDPRADLFPKTLAQVRLLQEQSSPDRLALEFIVDKNFARPDVIVYWVPGGSTTTNAVPDNAILLGQLGPHPLPLPAQIITSTGSLALYSLADGEMVEVSKPFTFQHLMPGRGSAASTL